MGILEFWMIFIIISIIAIIVEIFIPTMFCINFAIAGVITAIVSIFWGTLPNLFILFAVLSLLSIIFIKPILQNLLKKENNADFASQYIGKIVKVIEPVTTTSGAVMIYEERWEARAEYEAEPIPVDSDVKIIKNDSLILFVEKV